MKFSKEELQFIRQYSVHQPLSKSLIFFVCVLFAPVGFALYGALNNDSTAMFVAFMGLLVFIIWYIATSMKSEKTLNSLCEKLLQNEVSEFDET